MSALYLRMSKFYGLAKTSESDCDKVQGFFNLQPAQPQLEHAEYEAGRVLAASQIYLPFCWAKLEINCIQLITVITGRNMY